MKLPISLSIFFPAYNEEENIAATIASANRVAKESPYISDYEIIIVDDGSSDRTAPVANELAKNNPRVRVVEHGTNKGLRKKLLEKPRVEWRNWIEETLKIIKKKKGEIKTYVYYYCTHRKQGTQCTQKEYLPLKDMEEQIEREVMNLTILPEFKDWALEILNEQNDAEIVKRSKVRDMQQTALDGAQKRLDTLTQMRLRDMITDDEYMSEKSAIKSEIATLKTKIKETDDNADKWIELTEKAFEFATYAHSAFLNGDLQTKREILTALGQNFSLKDQKLVITPNDWLVPIIKKYPAIEKQYFAVRTKKYPSPARQKAAIAAIRPIVRERRDLNPQPLP